jgi:hypothetical protein
MEPIPTLAAPADGHRLVNPSVKPGARRWLSTLFDEPDAETEGAG